MEQQLSPQTPASFTPPVQPIEPHEFRKRYPSVAVAVLVLFVLALGLFFANLHFHFFDKQDGGQQEQVIVPSSTAEPSDFIDTQKIEQEEQVNTPAMQGELAAYLVGSAPVTETTTISGNMAVFVMPTDEQVYQMEDEIGDVDVFEEMLDDILYYSEVASRYLTNKGINVIFAKNRYLSFIVNTTTFYIDTEKIPPGFGNLMLFRDGVMPYIALPIDIKQEYNAYYQVN